MTDKQPEALRLADALNQEWSNDALNYDTALEAAAELRRLHQSEREGWRHAAELEQERERLTNLCHDYLGELTSMRAAKKMQQKIDDLRGVQRQWVGLTDESVVSAAARVLSDRVAASCNVDCGDMWMLHGNDSIEDARAMLEAAEAKLKENT